MERDTLLLLLPNFEDPAYPGRVFYCSHCALIEGVLASFPEHATRIDVQRVAWPRPRKTLVELLGNANQSLPVLVLAEGQQSRHQTGTHKGIAFIDDTNKLLAALSELHGFPDPHP